MENKIIKQYVIAIKRQVKALLKRYPFHNIVFLTLLAPVGYAFPLTFPLLFVMALGQLNRIIPALPPFDWASMLGWWPVIMWCALAIFLLSVCGRLLQIRPEKPAGFVLTRKLVPQLFDMIRDFGSIRGRMTIHRVIVTDRFELDIVKTRLCILPIWSHNTLVIGLPLAQMMPPNVFRAMVARKLCQHSLLRNPLLHWLHQLSGAWRQYRECFRAGFSPDYLIIGSFYRIFSTIYDFLAEPVARLDGLSADRYTLKVVNDEDMVESVEYLFVAGMFIEKVFWPKLHDYAYEKNRYDLKPFQTLAKTGHAYLSKLDINSWLAKEIRSGNSPRWGVASMRVRLDALGHNDIFNLSVISDSAAALYFNSRLPEIIKAVDSVWANKTIPDWRKQDDLIRSKRALMFTLQQRARDLDYGFRDLYQYTKTALRLGKFSVLPTILKMFFKTRITFTKKNRTVIAS